MVKQLTGALIPAFADADAGSAPLYLQVYRRLRAAVLGGSLAPGARLPSARTLAADIGVSRNTVEVAFAQLEAEGFIERRVGSGSYVADVLPEFPRASSSKRQRRGWPRACSDQTTRPAVRLSERGKVIVASAPTCTPTAVTPFAPCPAPLEYFPLNTWGRILARRLRSSGRELLSHHDRAGFRPLREAVAAHIGNARGVKCDWRQVVILTSTTQALDVTARMLLNPGDEVWLEEPAYFGARSAFQVAGARVVPVAVDDHGLIIEKGLSLAPSARLAYVTPSHQYPLGVTMNLARRLALLSWAERAESWIFEDDYDSEFRYVGRPLAAVQGIDTAGRVIYSGTFNKVMFPSIRLAYVVLPEDLIEPFVAARSLADGHSPALTQAALADFIAEGHFGGYIRQIKSLFQERRDALIRSVDEELGGVLRIGASCTGLHVTGWLPDGVDDTEVSRRAKELGLHASPLSTHYLSRHPDQRVPGGLILHYAAVTPPAIVRGVRTLAVAVTEQLKLTRQSAAS